VLTRIPSNSQLVGGRHPSNPQPVLVFSVTGVTARFVTILHQWVRLLIVGVPNPRKGEGGAFGIRRQHCA
jgi:hypothetical protein